MSQNTKRKLSIMLIALTLILPTIACNDDVNIYKGACVVNPNAPACK